MQNAGSILKNNNLAAKYGQPSQTVSAAIHQASTRTGVDFAYLMDQAKAESSYNPAAKAGTSSASGLFQFIERTWLDMVNRHGDKYGLEKYAEQIDGNLRVGNRAARQEILALRNDPQVASYMAAEFAADNKDFLQRTVGGEIGSTELYLAHFLGASGATGFLKELHHNPMTAAADIMPKAARANRAVFYDSKTGAPRTLQQVYDFFDKKFQGNYDAPQSMMAQDQTPAPAKIATIEKPRAYAYKPTLRTPSPAFVDAAPSRSLSSVLSEDQVPRTRTLADYRNDALPVARARDIPAAPLSIADLLMLSSADL